MHALVSQTVGICYCNVSKPIPAGSVTDCARRMRCPLRVGLGDKMQGRFGGLGNVSNDIVLTSLVCDETY